MNRVSDRELRAWLADALEPPRRQEVAKLLDADRALAERLASLASPPAPAPEALVWSMPPPGLGTLKGAPVAVMAATPSDAWVRLLLPASVPADHWVVVLERADGLWTVVSPQGPEEVVRVGELPLEGEVRQLDLAAGPEADRLGALLVPADRTVDWSAPDTVRWGALLEEAFQQRWPMGTVEVRR